MAEHATETPNVVVVSPALRKAIYGLAAAAGALLVVLGLVTPDAVAAWLNVIGQAVTVASLLLAVVNVPKR